MCRSAQSCAIVESDRSRLAPQRWISRVLNPKRRQNSLVPNFYARQKIPSKSSRCPVIAGLAHNLFHNKCGEVHRRFCPCRACDFFAQDKNSLINQGLHLNPLSLLTTLSTEVGHNCAWRDSRCAIFKLSNYFLMDQALGVEGLALLTLLSTENVENSARHLLTCSQHATLRHSRLDFHHRSSFCLPSSKPQVGPSGYC
ncbi:hypothetical protein FHW58_003463 [Duganella sp. 1224]|nr:hypothetical protein [Duganella sp. 1224]